MIYSVAGLTVRLEAQHGLLASRLEPYRISGDGVEPDITIDVNPEFLEQKKAMFPNLNLAECEYLFTGEAFYRELLLHSGFMLHASAVAFEGRAFLFSAPSGTGKSTHTHLWLDYFGDKAVIINDDKPALRLVDGQLRAYGTPWSGKTDESVNAGYPLAAIAFIERAVQNSIRRISPVAALKSILDQTVRPPQAEYMDRLLSLLDGLLTDYPVYKLSCDMSPEAVRVAYTEMSTGR